MHPPRQVPKLGRGPQQFAAQNLPPIQSPMMLPQQPMQQQAADEPFQDLAMEIFARLAVDHIRKQSPDAQTLRELAKSANQAALAYFEEVMK